jgi:hypothetical protein
VPSTTGNGRSAMRTTAGRFNSAVVGSNSIHGCADPGQVSAMNCIWPQRFGSADGRTVRYGIVVHTLEPGGNFTVNHSP